MLCERHHRVLIGGTKYTNFGRLPLIQPNFRHFNAVLRTIYSNKKAIPIGCPLPAFLTPRGRPAGGEGLPKPLGCRPPCRQTSPSTDINICENITLSHFSFAVSNSRLASPWVGSLSWKSWICHCGTWNGFVTITWWRLPTSPSGVARNTLSKAFLVVNLVQRQLASCRGY